MEVLRIKDISDNYFKEAWKLYEDSFPMEERRLIETQLFVLQNDTYHFDVLLNEGQFSGLILWWDFDTFRFIDHFATAVEKRNNGLGQLILNGFMEREDKSIILEVELPSSRINERRIKFYERVGFKLNQHYYEIPLSAEGQSALQLLLMSYPNMLSEKEVTRIVEICHPIMFSKS
jgi:GNAT superfamily N-acetyltransferase